MSKKPLIGIIDTNTSNIKSVYYALSHLNVEIEYITSANFTKNIDAMIVPGIGSFGYVMRKLNENKLNDFILKKISMNIPSLFICVGMQILFSKSFEIGEHKGLDYFQGNVIRIKDKDLNEKKIRTVPMIGWNTIDIKNNYGIFEQVEQNSFFYFTHSYYVEPNDSSLISSTCCYKGFNYCSSISKKNIFATQFHPEKSGKIGLKIYKNFINTI